MDPASVEEHGLHCKATENSVFDLRYTDTGPSPSRLDAAELSPVGKALRMS